jgi:hypothetical protein
MPSNESSFDSVPMPALLAERAIALARAEAGLALAHVRRIAVRAVSALLGTIVACAFAQLTLLLLVAWPVLSSRISLVNLLFGVLASGLLAVAGAAFAVLSWAGVGRERKTALSGNTSAKPVDPKIAPSALGMGPAAAGSETSSAARSPSEPARAENGRPEPTRTINRAERVSL